MDKEITVVIRLGFNGWHSQPDGCGEDDEVLRSLEYRLKDVVRSEGAKLLSINLIEH